MRPLSLPGRVHIEKEVEYWTHFGDIKFDDTIDTAFDVRVKWHSHERVEFEQRELEVQPRVEEHGTWKERELINRCSPVSLASSSSQIPAITEPPVTSISLLFSMVVNLVRRASSCVMGHLSQ